MLIIIIIMYYILSNLSADAQQARIINYTHEQARAQIIRITDHRFLTEMQGLGFYFDIVSDDYKVMGSSFQTLGSTTEKSRFSK